LTDLEFYKMYDKMKKYAYLVFRLILNKNYKTNKNERWLSNLSTLISFSNDKPMICRPKNWVVTDVGTYSHGGYLLHSLNFYNLKPELANTVTFIEPSLVDNINYLQNIRLRIDRQMLDFWLKFSKKLQGKSSALIDLMGCSHAKSLKMYNNDIEQAKIDNMTDNLDFWVIADIEKKKRARDVNWRSFTSSMTEAMLFWNKGFHLVYNIDYRTRIYPHGSLTHLKSKVCRSLLSFPSNKEPFICTKKQFQLLTQSIYYYYSKKFEKDFSVINNFLKEIENKSLEYVLSKAKEPEKFMKNLYAYYNCKDQNKFEPIVQLDATAFILQIIGTVTRNHWLMKISNVIHNDDLYDPYKEIYDSVSKDEKISILKDFLEKKKDSDTSKAAFYAKKIYDDIESSVDRKWLKLVFMTHIYGSGELTIAQKLEQIHEKQWRPLQYRAVAYLFIQIISKKLGSTKIVLDSVLNIHKKLVSEENSNLIIKTNYIVVDNSYSKYRKNPLRINFIFNGLKIKEVPRSVFISKENSNLTDNIDVELSEIETFDIQTEDIDTNIADIDQEKEESEKENLEDNYFETKIVNKWQTNVKTIDYNSVDKTKTIRALLANMTQAIDAEIAHYVIGIFAKEKKYILTIHDCFVVKISDVDLLKRSVYNYFII